MRLDVLGLAGAGGGVNALLRQAAFFCGLLLGLALCGLLGG